jgi:NADH-quinone oxidoreductase E subunit
MPIINLLFERSAMKANPKSVSRIIEKYKGNKSALIAVLQDIQEKYNWLPPEALKMVSERLSVPMTDIYSVATFYRAFSLAPRGKHIVTVCLGTACHVRGAQAVLDRLEERLEVEPGCTTVGGTFTLESVNCLGACALAPIVVVDGKYYGQTTVQKVDKIIDPYQDKYQRRKTTRKRKK